MKRFFTSVLACLCVLAAMAVTTQNGGTSIGEQKKPLTLNNTTRKNTGKSFRAAKASSTEGFRKLGMGMLNDNFFRGSASVEIWQDTEDNNYFRIMKPFDGITNVDGATYAGSDYFDLVIAQPDDTWGDITITTSDLVFFGDCNTGGFDEDDNDYIWMLHPFRFIGMSESDCVHNKVLSYQWGTMPNQIQLAPFYYIESSNSGWNYSQFDNKVIITFPYVPPFPNLYFVSVACTNSNPGSLTTSDVLQLKAVYGNEGADGNVVTCPLICSKDGNLTIIKSGNTRSDYYSSGQNKTVNYSISLSDVPAGSYYATTEYYLESANEDEEGWYYSPSCLVDITVVKPVESISLNYTSATITSNNTLQLVETVSPTDATNKTVTWSSSNTNVATVSSSGLVTAKYVTTAGTATITCTANDGSGVKATCTVTVKPIEPTGITISPSSKTIDVGETFQASYTLTPTNAVTTVTWSSDDESIATVTQTGVVTGVKAGSTWINVKTANGKMDYFKLTVNASIPVEKISLWWSTTVHLNGTKKLTPTLTPANTTSVLTWTSSDESVATVDENGLVSGKKVGTALIRATADNGKTDYCVVKVVKVFTAQTTEGKTMTFQILDETEKTCQAGEDPTWTTLFSASVTTRALGYYTSGAVTIPGTADGYTVTGIGDLAFLSLPYITSVTIPNTVTSIGEYAFQGCNSIESFEIPSSVTDIQNYAFSMCEKLSSVTLPSTITILNDGLFWDDPALKTVDIPASVTKIGWSVFTDSGLEEITIPNAVTYIGWYAFADCNNLNKVISEIEEPFEINENVFQNTVDDETSFTTATLFVPRGTKSAYEATSAWNQFAKIEESNDSNLKGDVNGDGYVNGTDLVVLTNIILGKSENRAAADVNQDGYVNGTDYVVLANIILGRSNARGMDYVANESGSAGLPYLEIEPFEISAGEEKEMVIDLVNPDDEITLVQFDLDLPQGLTLKVVDGDYDIDIAGRTTWKKHSLNANAQADGTIRFLLASSSNTALSGTDGAIITMTLVADDNYTGGGYALRNILLVTPDEKETKPGDITVGIRSINANDRQDAPVYSIAGQRIAAPQKGINIIGGKKVVVK